MPKTSDQSREQLFKQFEAIAAHMLAQEFVVACLVETLAKTQPATGESLFQAMKESLKTNQARIDKHPGVQAQLEKYLALIHTQLAKKPQ